MPILLLRNYDQNAAVQQVSFDIQSGMFTAEDGQQVSRRELLTALAFQHPILDEKALNLTRTGRYTYVYRNYAELLLALRYVYATLLRVSNPAECAVRIRPAPDYLKDTTRNEIYFSCHIKKAARQTLSTREISAMFSEVYGFPFQYGNEIILDKTVTYLDLVETMNADDLYQEPEVDPEWFQYQIPLDKYELRYINQRIGCGVFARTHIPKGELICRYNGKFVPQGSEYQSYCYLLWEHSSFNLALDAAHYGNLSRFINHAPIPAECDVDPNKFLCANVRVEHHCWYGNDHVIYVAARDIACGEQVLSSYGKSYFEHSNTRVHIKKNGTIVDTQYRKIQDTPLQKKQRLSIFARHGVQHAQWLLLRKPLFMLLLCIILGFLPQYK